MAYPFLKAKGFEIGKSMCHEDDISLANEYMNDIEQTLKLNRRMQNHNASTQKKKSIIVIIGIISELICSLIHKTGKIIFKF